MEKKTAISIIGYEKCTGCYGCLNTCPVQGAIEFKRDMEGFYKPFITEKCIECGNCQKSCPVIVKNNKNEEKDIKTYSCWSKDKNILKNSSSGGIFSELAKEYLMNGGVVYGAKWFEGEIIHIGITNFDELGDLQKSKYLQSKVETSYLEVKNRLNNGKKVLFVGTPCQIAALNTIVTHENLVTVDLVCHGLPSYKSFDKYIKEEFPRINKKNLKVDFRNKDEGWENFNLIFKIKEDIIAKNNLNRDPFFRGFLKNIYLNKACYNCEFRTLPRQADITLGDFWGVPKPIKNIEGTSVVTINSIKGFNLFEKISENIIKMEVEYNLALKGNPCLAEYNMSTGDRSAFFEDIDKMSFIDLQKKYWPFPNPIISFIRRGLGVIKRKMIKIIRREL